MRNHKLRESLFKNDWEPALRMFVDHAKHDPNLPDAESWSELESYLENLRIFPGDRERLQSVIDAAQNVWLQYSRRNIRIVR